MEKQKEPLGEGEALGEGEVLGEGEGLWICFSWCFSLVLWWGWLHRLGFPHDEGVYVRAIKAVLEGRSPYEVYGYLYPPTMAYGGSLLGWLLGERGAVLVLRALNLWGASVVGYLVLRGWGLRRGVAAWGSGVVLMVLPPLSHGLAVGNLSLFAGGCGLLALRLWPRAPWWGACWLSVSLLVKPIFALVWLMLWALRDRRAWKMALFSGFLCGVALLSVWWELGGMLRQMGHNRMQETAFLLSWRNLFQQAGILLPGWGFTAIWGVVGFFLVLRLRPSSGQFEGLSLVVALYSLPLVWDHTLVAILPMMSVVVRAWWEKWRSFDGLEGKAREEGRSRWWLAGLGWGGASLGLLFCDHLGDLIELPRILTSLGVFLLLLCLGVLGWGRYRAFSS